MELVDSHDDAPPPALIIIASSIQVIPHYAIYVQPFATVESWNLFPSEQSRLFDLVKRASSRKASPSRVVFLSGDVHLVIDSAWSFRSLAYRHDTVYENQGPRRGWDCCCCCQTEQGAISRIPRGCRGNYGQDLVDVTSSGRRGGKKKGSSYRHRIGHLSKIKTLIRSRFVLLVWIGLGLGGRESGQG